MKHECSSTTLSKPIPITEQVWIEGTLPLVSIACITYNHESFIKECIEGFLIQKTTFPVEVIIHDDASTDSTVKILKGCEERYSNLFRIIYQSENQYSKKQGSIYTRFVFPKAKGKYIAMCEGDDYWTDPLKLQKQVDYMETHNDCSLCFHNAKILNYNKQKYTTFKVPQNTFFFSTKDIIRLKWFIPTASMVFRKDLLPKQYPNWMTYSKSGDISIQLLMSNSGYLFYLPCVMSVYRLGVPHSITDRNRKNPLFALKNYIKTLEMANQETFDGRYDWDVRYRKGFFYLSVIKYYFKKIWKSFF